MNLKRYIKWLPVLLAGITIGLGIFMNLPISPQILTGLIIVFFVIQIIILQLEIQGFKNTRPNIIPDISMFNKLEDPLYLWPLIPHTNHKIKRYYLPLRNKRPPKSEINLVDTDAINTKINFYDLNLIELTQLSHEKVFWFNALPRIERKTKEDHIFKIPASGKAEGICLVYKFLREKDLFVFTDDCYDPGIPNILLNENLKIIYEAVYACVELTMANLFMDPIWVKITNQGSDMDPLFELIKNPFSERESNHQKKKFGFKH